MTNIVKNAIAERKKLELELSSHPAFEKIKLLDAIIANFSKITNKKSQKITKKDQILQLAKESIKANGGHAKLGTVADYIQKQGTKVHIGMLKSYMYKYKELKSSRANGFSIR